MTTIATLFRSSVSILLILNGLTWAAHAQEIIVPDSGLNAAIRETLQKPNDPLTTQDLLGLTNLNACCRNIANIYGLEAARHLATLDLQSNSFISLDLPASLTNLQTLNLSHNALTNLTLPPELTRLSALDLKTNPLLSFVLSQPLGATNLSGTVFELTNQGIAVFTYPVAPQLVRPLMLVGAFKFGLTGPPGVYSVLSSTNLAVWDVVGESVNPLGSVNFRDLTPSTSPQKYYRVQRQIPPANMVFIPPGTFTMGSPTNELHRESNEGPQTSVTLTRGFWIGRYEVTQGEYLSVMNTNPSEFPGDLSRPISSVSWPDATNYCWQLTQQELVAGRIAAGSQYRLPTEAEWEYAARAGTTTRFSYGDDPNYASLTNHAWFSDNSGFSVHQVGRKLPNPWGLYDMEGNVWEWCQDWLGPLPGGTVTDPAGPDSNPIGWKVIRGGGFDFGASDCRSARRYFFGSHPALTDYNLGFRVVLVLGP